MNAPSDDGGLANPISGCFSGNWLRLEARSPKQRLPMAKLRRWVRDISVRADRDLACDSLRRWALDARNKDDCDFVQAALHALVALAVLDDLTSRIELEVRKKPVPKDERWLDIAYRDHEERLTRLRVREARLTQLEAQPEGLDDKLKQIGEGFVTRPLGGMRLVVRELAVKQLKPFGGVLTGALPVDMPKRVAPVALVNKAMREGVPSLFRIELVPGSSLLYEAPAYAFVDFDPVWRAAESKITDYFKENQLLPKDLDACWWLFLQDHNAEFPLQLSGESFGLSLTLGILKELVLRKRITDSKHFALRLAAIDLRPVLPMAAVERSGRLKQVGDDYLKFLAARDKFAPKIHTIIAAREQEEALRRQYQLNSNDCLDGIRFLFAETVEEAVGKLADHLAQRRWQRWRGWFLSGGLAVVVGILLSIWLKQLDLANLLEKGRPPSAASANKAALEFHVLFKKQGESQFSPLRGQDTLRSSVDDYMVIARSLTPGYLYVVQIDAAGKVDWLYPTNSTSAFSSGTNPVSAGVRIQIPSRASQRAFYLDDTTGLETIYAVFSTERWDDLEGLLQSTKRVSTTFDPSRTAPQVRAPGGYHTFETVIDAEQLLARFQDEVVPLVISNQVVQSSTSSLILKYCFRHVE